MNGADRRAVAVAGSLLAVVVLGEMLYPFPFFLCALVSVCSSYGVLRYSRLRGEELLGLGILVWAAAAAVFATPDRFASRNNLGIWLTTWLIWIIVGRTEFSGRKIIEAILVGGAVMMSAGIMIESLSGFDIRSGGFFENPNLSAAVILPGLALVLRKNRGLFVLSGAVFLGGGVLLSQSRAAVLGLVVLVFFTVPEGRPRRIFGGVGIFVAFAAITWRILYHSGSLAWFRWEIWRAVGSFVADHPVFGAGSGPLSDVMGPYRIMHPFEPGRWGHVIAGAENLPLGLAARIGIPGLVLGIVVFMLWMWRRCPWDRKTLAVVAVCGVMAVFHDFVEEPAILWWWAALGGLIGSGPPRKEDRRHPFAALALSAFVALVVLPSSWASVLWWSVSGVQKPVERCLRADPEFTPALEWVIGQTMRRSELDWEEGLRALDASRKDCRIRKGVAQAWEMSGKLNLFLAHRLAGYPEFLQGARTAFRRQEELEPHLPWPPFNLAVAQRAAGNDRAALVSLNRALADEPRFCRGLLLRARIRLDMGDVSGAREDFEKALNVRSFLEKLKRENLFEGGHLLPYHLTLLQADQRQFEQLEGLLK